MFKIIKVKDYEEMSDKAFDVVKEVVDANPKCVLGLATGSSPVGLYQRMIKDHQENGTSYADVTTFNLDEYCGLPKSHPESYYSFMHRNLFSGLNIPEENIHIPEDGEDKEAKCKEYDASMESYTVDLQVLGIGSNGHIGFNEPGTAFDTKTHIVTLKESTRQDNARFFDSIDKVPTHAITMGIDTIMHAKKIIIVASGANKADAIYAMIHGPKTTDVPASVLQDHPDVVVVVDAEAGKLL
ncbi:MAG: glucosamine-6-phosphate deaminase [Erysipelotrichaceae bacterium]|nr:glucosamine-6-phosphate deaminase [Erysipelotrichaceae bacterium]